MRKIAFKMKLRIGMAEAYRQRHDDIWPELVQALKGAGIEDYSIHHDPGTGALFASLWCSDALAMDALSTLPVMRRWWESMAPLMETNPDGSPVAVPLETMFHLA